MLPSCHVAMLKHIIQRRTLGSLHLNIIVMNIELVNFFSYEFPNVVCPLLWPTDTFDRYIR